MIARASFFFLFALVLGCSQPVLEVGTGVDSFEPIADGDSIPIVMGPQGGYHIAVSLRAHRLDPANVMVELDVAPLANRRPRQTTSFPVDFVPNAEGGYERLGLAAGLFSIECFRDRDVLLRTTTVDQGGRTASDERIIVPRFSGTLVECEE